METENTVEAELQVSKHTMYTCSFYIIVMILFVMLRSKSVQAFQAFKANCKRMVYIDGKSMSSFMCC